MGKVRNRKFRGSNTCGYGSKKKHRGKGSRGGVGFAGSKKHRMQMFKMKCPEHYDHRALKKKAVCRVINLEDLNKFETPEVNLTEMGYEKLLGLGEPKKKLKVTVARWSKSAEEKIKAAGGEIIEG
ncbi:MAG: uL15 family ribosomal protein [Candidatus Aenigmarchaeota archaeon]|nr:uL15 family ribosomal protein [Candidatus Aenigmarchaeota archaeon]